MRGSSLRAHTFTAKYVCCTRFYSSYKVLWAKARMENIQKLVKQNPLDGNLCKEKASVVKEYDDISRAVVEPNRASSSESSRCNG
jgi:hypothetical protein